MKITKEQIKQLIKEEIAKVLYEEEEEGYDYENHPLLNVRRIEEGNENFLPLQYGDELMTIYSYKTSEILYKPYFEGVEEEYKEKIINLTKDNIFVLFDGTSQSNSTIQLMTALDSEFKGYPIGELVIGNGGETGLKVEWLGNSLDIIEGKDNIENGEIEINYGYGLVSPREIGSIVEDEVDSDGELASDAVYVSSWDGGMADYDANMDYPTTANIRINKILDDIASGKLGMEVVADYGEFKYKVEKY